MSGLLPVSKLERAPDNSTKNTAGRGKKNNGVRISDLIYLKNFLIDEGAFLMNFLISDTARSIKSLYMYLMQATTIARNRQEHINL